MIKHKMKVVEAGGRKYRLSKLDARSASYLAMKVAVILGPYLGQSDSSQAGTAGLAKELSSLPRAEFDEIQTMLLQTVALLTDVEGTPMPQPIIRADGQFVDQDMVYDAKTVMMLTVQAAVFNIGDFFGDGGLIQAATE